MHKSVLFENISIIKKQRNLFLVIALTSVLSNLFLGFKLATTDEKVVLVPGLRQEMTVSNHGVSKSYLEEFALLFLSNLLDLSPSDIGHKKDLVLKYTSNNNKSAMKQIVDYFASSERDYKRFGISTYFTVKNLEIDLETLSVIAHGLLTSYYGKKGYVSEDEDYQIDFEFQGGQLRLKSFARIITEEKRVRDEAKKEKFESAIGLVPSDSSRGNNA